MSSFSVHLTAALATFLTMMGYAQEAIAFETMLGALALILSSINFSTRIDP